MPNGDAVGATLAHAHKAAHHELLLGSGRLTRRTSGVGVEHMWSSPCPWPRATLSRTVRSVQQAIELWSVRGKLWHPPDGRSGRRHWGTLACADVQHALVDAAFDQRRVGHGARVDHAALQRRHREHATHTGQGGGGLASVHALLAQQSARGGKRRVGVRCACVICRKQTRCGQPQQ